MEDIFLTSMHFLLLQALEWKDWKKDGNYFGKH